LFVAWIAFPVALGLLVAGLGLLVGSLSRSRLPGALIGPLGFAALVVLGEFTTIFSSTASLTVPVVVAGAVAGFALAAPSGWRRLDRWAVVCALGVFAVFAAPVVLSGEPTFGGFIKLDDTATWFALTDRVMSHGHSLAGLPPSTYEATLAFNLGAGYPIGVFIPFGVGAKLVGQDVSVVFQPYLAFLASLLALTLYALTERVLASRPARAGIAFIAAQSALLYGYSLWGGVKELAIAALLPLTAAVVVPVLGERTPRVRALVPVAVVAAAMLGVASGAGGIIWLGPMLLLAVALYVRRAGLPAAARAGGAFLALTAVISVPWLLASGFVPPTSSPLTSGTAIGNLIHPLNVLQVAGIWPSGDFRLSPHHAVITAVLVVAAVATAIGGVIWLVRLGRAEVATYVIGAAVTGLGIFVVGSAWVGGKALASASPALLFAALCAVGLMFERGARGPALAIAAALGAGVLWSNALGYHDVWLAPRAQLAELQSIGQLISGQGPTLMTEYEPYGARHFLRDAAPEGDSELRRRTDALRDGKTVPKGGYADIDRLQLPAVMQYRTLVLRRSPVESRPPSPYSPVWSGTRYQVWQRPPGAPTPLEHLSLGSVVAPAEKPSCAAVRELAQLPGTARIAYVARANPEVLRLDSAGLPDGWSSAGGGSVLPGAPGSVTIPVTVPRSGAYAVWVGGSFRGRMSASVDGRAAGEAEAQLNNTGQYTRFGALTLRPGRHRITLDYEDRGWSPGAGGRPFTAGPLVLAPAHTPDAVRYTTPAKATTLCGRELDWVEALPG
jgi:hypothetical protein